MRSAPAASATPATLSAVNDGAAIEADDADLDHYGRPLRLGAGEREILARLVVSASPQRLSGPRGFTMSLNGCYRKGLTEFYYRDADTGEEFPRGRYGQELDTRYGRLWHRLVGTRLIEIGALITDRGRRMLVRPKRLRRDDEKGFAHMEPTTTPTRSDGASLEARIEAICCLVIPETIEMPWRSHGRSMLRALLTLAVRRWLGGGPRPSHDLLLALTGEFLTRRADHAGLSGLAQALDGAPAARDVNLLARLSDRELTDGVTMMLGLLRKYPEIDVEARDVEPTNDVDALPATGPRAIGHPQHTPLLGSDRGEG